MARRLSAADLTPYAKRTLEDAYADADRRARYSRDDFYSGWVSAMAHYNVAALFQPEAWAEYSSTGPKA